jgi:hypothetical protein
MGPLLQILFRFLEVIFFVGIAGSVIVLVITTVEDMAVLFEKDAPAPGTTSVSATRPPAIMQAD